MTRLSRAAALLIGLGGGLLLTSPAMAQGPHAAWRGQLVATESGQCLAGLAMLDLRRCDRAPVVSVLPAHGGEVFIRDDVHHACLFGNRDGRFGWYICNPKYADQRWRLEGAHGGPARPGHRMRLVATHAGKCLVVHRDGRFGMASCDTPRGNVFWRLTDSARPPPFHELPPPPAPAPPPRPMDPEHFHQLAHAIKAESFSQQKLGVLKSAAAHAFFTCAQVGRLIDLYTFGNDKVEAARIARPHIVDPENGFTLSSHFTFSTNKQAVQQMFQ